MDIQLTRVQDARITDCRNVISHINSMDFVSLDDKEVRTLVMIREICSGIVNGQRKLASEGDVSRILKSSIECMVESCRKIVYQLSRMSFQDLNEQEKKSVEMVLKIAQEVISKQGVVAMSRYMNLEQTLELEVEKGLVSGETETWDMELEPCSEVDAELENEHGCVCEKTSEDFVRIEIKHGNVDDANGGKQLAVVDCLDGDENSSVRTFGDIEMEHKSGDNEWLAVYEHCDLGKGQNCVEINEHTRELISWPLNGEVTQDWTVRLMETFKWFCCSKFPSEISSIMPLLVVEQLLGKASSVLSQEPNCVKVQCDKNTKVIVVGDLHGQYLDLLTIWEGAGLPSGEQFFVFNGDYVDRGLSSLELFLVLLAWKVSLPQRVYLLRGNHESRGISKICGFWKEINHKFPEHGQTVYQKCLEVFAKLPLASIIADCVYTSHGGLFRSEEISSTRSFEGKKVQNSKRNRTGRSNGKKKQKMSTTITLGSLDELAQVNRFTVDPLAKDSILTDVLWSEPTVECGLMENDEHEMGLLWGPDCTETFLKQSKLKVIIRSHGPNGRADQKGMLTGYSTDHEVESGKLYTLFSALDYPQCYTIKEYKKKGAYAVLKPPDFDTPDFISFEATKRPEVKMQQIQVKNRA